MPPSRSSRDGYFVLANLFPPLIREISIFTRNLYHSEVRKAVILSRNARKIKREN